MTLFNTAHTGSRASYAPLYALRRKKSLVLTAFSLFLRLIGLGMCGIVGMAVGIRYGLQGSLMVATIALMLLTAFGILQIIEVERARQNAFNQATLLAEAIESSGEGRLIADMAGNQIYANIRFQNLTRDIPIENQNEKMNALALLQKLLRSDSNIEDKIDDIFEAVKRGESRELEAAVRINGTPTMLRVIGQPISQSKIGSKMTRSTFSGIGLSQWRIEDVSRQRAIEQWLMRDRNRQLDFMQNAPVGFFSVDRHGRFLFANAQLAQWLGTTPEHLLSNEHVLQDFLVNPPSNGAAHDMFDGDNPEQKGELLMRGLDGRVFIASVAQSLAIEADGSIRTRSVVRDLTPEREYQEALRLSEHRFQRFFEEAPLGIALLDSDGIISECNLALPHMLDKSVDSVRGVSLLEYVSPAQRSMLESRLRMTADEQMPSPPIEVQFNGTRQTTAQLFLQPYSMDGNAQKLIVLHAVDFTEMRKLEQQFVQSQKMQAVGQLAGGIAHDFNNLLTAMIGFCDLLLLRHKPGDSSFGDIMQIKQNANRAANLVRQLLAFSRQQTLQPKTLDVTDVLADLGHLLRRLIGENIELSMIHGRDLWLIKVDQGQLEQVLVNLVVNARDAMPGGGRLTLRTYNYANDTTIRRGAEEMPAGEWTAIEVSDTGIGIPEENLSRIFEPFFSTKEIGAGTGLGLSTVYGIVRQTGGFVAVESAPASGAVFTIFLPRTSVIENTVSQRADDGEGRAVDLTGADTILLVEDEDAVRMFSARALRNKGYTVIEAASGEEALEAVAKLAGKIDLIISDVVMPNMDGPTLLGKIRPDYPDLKVIFISGYTEDRFKGQFDVGSNRV